MSQLLLAHATNTLDPQTTNHMCHVILFFESITVLVSILPIWGSVQINNVELQNNEKSYIFTSVTQCSSADALDAT